LVSVIEDWIAAPASEITANGATSVMHLLLNNLL
jgi:hypothetical protein